MATRQHMTKPPAVRAAVYLIVTIIALAAGAAYVTNGFQTFHWTGDWAKFDQIRMTR